VTTAQTQRIPAILRQLSHKTLILVALLFTIFQVTWSFRAHRLALEPDSDDDFYLTDTIRLIDVLDHQGPIPFVQALLKDPPHSPFTTGVCLLGLLFGVQGLAGPYLVNGLLVFVLLAEVNRLASGLSTVTRWALLAGILLVPFTRLMVVELRPDFAVGLFGAIGYLRLAQMVLRTDRATPREIGLCSLALALTLLAKPTFFPHTVVMTGLAVAVSLFLSLLLDKRLSPFRWGLFLDRLKPCVWAISGCLVLVIPYYVYAYRLVWDYIVECIWGEGQWRWQVNGGMWGAVHYYFSGAGAVSIGSYFNLFLVIIFVGLVYLPLRHRFYQAAELIVGFLLAIASATVIILGGIGNPTFNLTAQLLLTLTAIIALNYLLTGVPWKYLQAAAVLPVLFIGFLQTPLRGVMDRERLANRGITTKVVEAIESLSAGNSNFPSKPIRVAMPGYALLHDSSLWILSHNRGFTIDAYDLGDYSDLETVMTKLATADFVCLSETPNAPIGFVNIDGELFARFAADPQFEFKTRIPFGNQAIWLYQRRTNSKP
jgi:hypothetical protein